MNIQNTSRSPIRTFNRRTIVRGALAAAAVVPLSSALAACAGGGSDDDSDSDTKGGTKSADNPFGMAENSTIDAVIFDGGYGTDYVSFAAAIMQKNFPGSTVKVSATTEIAQELQPRFVGGDPPDLIDNSGENAIGFSTILDQLEDLGDVLDAPNLEGTTIRDTLFGGVEAAGHLRRQAGGAQLRADGVRRLVLREPVRGRTAGRRPKTWDDAIDARRRGQEGRQVPVPVGQGGGDVLPDPGDRLGDQAGRRRGAPRPREPAAGLLVPARGAGRLRGDGRDRLGRLHEAGRLGHPVHGRPGPVEQQPGRAALPVGLVDRERDEGPDQARLPDDRVPGDDGRRPTRPCPTPRCTAPPASRS